MAGRWLVTTFRSEDRSIGHLHMSNHRPNGVVSDPGYAITLSDLRLLDAKDQLAFDSAGPNLRNVRYDSQSVHAAPVAST
jgi:hypothetical protein